MLILSRMKDQVIVLCDKGDVNKVIAEIIIVDVRGDKVRLGVTAPPDYPVHRKEVHEAILKEKNSMSENPPNNKNTSVKNMIDK